MHLGAPRIPDDRELSLPAGTIGIVIDDDTVVLSIPAPPPQLPAALTLVEQDIALRVFAGESNQQIAQGRRTSPSTVHNQLQRIFRKLGVSSRWELVLLLRS